MKATLVSIFRRKHRIQNSNLKSRSFRYGYLLLSLCLLFLVSVPVFAVDESGNVLSSVFEIPVEEFYFRNLTSDLSSFPDISVYSVPNDFNFNRVGFDPFYEFSGTNRIYSTFFSLPSFNVLDYKFFSFEYNCAVMSSNVLITNYGFNFVDAQGNPFNLASLYDGDYGISLNYNGVDISGVNTYFFGEVSDLSFYSPSGYIQAYVDVRVTGSQNFNVFGSPLTIKLYKNYQDVIADVNSNVQQIINQNDVIINNLNEVKGQLNNIHNSLSSDNNPDNPELDSELSDANQIEQDFKDKFQDFVDIDKIDRVENIITDWTNNTKILSSFIFVRNVLDLLFDEVPVLSILFSVGSACIILTMLFGIVSHSFRSPSGNVAQDPRSYTYNYIMFSNLSQQQTLSSKKADFHAFEKYDGSWGV